MTDEENITAAVYGAIAGIVLRGSGINPRQVVAALDRVQHSLAQLRAYWLKQAEEYLAEVNLRSLRTEAVQVALTDLVREQIDGSGPTRSTKTPRRRRFSSVMAGVRSSGGTRSATS